MRYSIKIYATNEKAKTGRSLAAGFDVDADDVTEALVKVKGVTEDLTSDQRSALCRVMIEEADGAEDVTFKFPSDDDDDADDAKSGKGGKKK